MDVSTRLVPPVFLTVIVWGAEIVPTFVLGIEGGEKSTSDLSGSGRITSIFGPDVPVPLRLTVTVVSSASFDVITMLALEVTSAVGENFTLT